MANGFKDSQDFKTQCGYEIGGIWYPRVTRIVEMKAKPMLYQFYGTVGYKEGLEISRKSAEEGTAIHEAAEKILIGEIPSNTPESLRPSIKALWDFLQTQDIDVQAEHVERRILNKNHRYAGTIDAMATINGKFGVLDIKTSESIYRDYNIQTSAYVDALKEEFPKISTRWILRIDQSHTCKRCGATLRKKGGREKIKNGFGEYGRKNSLFGNGFSKHYDVVKTCPEAEHDWADCKGAVELKELHDWESDFQAFLGAKKLWEWEYSDYLKEIGY